MLIPYLSIQITCLPTLQNFKNKYHCGDGDGVFPFYSYDAFYILSHYCHYQMNQSHYQGHFDACTSFVFYVFSFFYYNHHHLNQISHCIYVNVSFDGNIHPRCQMMNRYNVYAFCVFYEMFCVHHYLIVQSVQGAFCVFFSSLLYPLPFSWQEILILTWKWI